MAQQSLTVNWSITVEGSGLSITSPPPPTTGRVGQPYTHTVTVTGGVAPYIWSVVQLPSWMTLTPGFGGASAVVSGTPTAPGPVAASLRVTDSGTP